jgi:NitT/TauT family transport system permease protein
MSTKTQRLIIGIKPWFIRSLSVLIALTIWTYAESIYGGYLVSSPVAVAQRFIEMSLNGMFAEALYATGRIILGGLLLSVVVGIPLGILIGSNKLMDWIANPFVTIFYILPPVGLVPLFIIWFGLDYNSKVLLTFVFGVLPIIINVRVGVKDVSDKLLEVGDSMEATSYQKFRKILLPGTVPHVVSGIRHSIARCLIGAIVAEIFLSAVGIGEIILRSTSVFDIRTNIATLLLLALLSLLFTKGVQIIEYRLFPWRAVDN